MTMPQPRPRPAPTVLETGNVAFFYRPMPGTAHPQSSDEIEHAYFVLFPDDQNHHQNRLFTCAHGYLPPVIPGQNLPEERDWACVAEVSHDPRAVVEALEATRPKASAPRGRPARVAGAGRYLIAHRGDHSYFAYALAQPRQLGPAQQTLLLETEACYVVLVKEPYVPDGLPAEGKPDYPDALGEKFDGHASIPLDPTDFLDYRWTQVRLISAQTDAKRELGVAPNPLIQNHAEEKALQFLRGEAERVKKRSQVEILKPLLDGELE